MPELQQFTTDEIMNDLAISFSKCLENSYSAAHQHSFEDAQQWLAAATEISNLMYRMRARKDDLARQFREGKL